MKGMRRAGIVLALTVLVGGCGRGCSCSPLARADDPMAFIPDDAAAVLEMDLGDLDNNAIFRKVVTTLWEKGSCLVPMVLDHGQSLVMAMPDTRPDEKTIAYGVIVVRDRDPVDVVGCLNSELFPEAGSPEEEEYRGVRHWGYPERMPVRLGVVNRNMLLVGDRGGIHKMVDTLLDGKPSLKGSVKFAKARALLPEGAQVRLVAMPGEELRKSAREQLKSPWNVILDSEMVVAGLVFGEDDLALKGVARREGEAEQMARAGNKAVDGIMRNKILRMFGVADMLAETRFDAKGKDVILDARAPGEIIGPFLESAGQMVEIGL